MKSGIYKITNITNNKIYIGSSVNIKQRFAFHLSGLKLNKHPSKHLQSAWNKYGEQAFVFEVIEYCEKEKLIEREQCWIDFTKCYDRKIGYNTRKIADSNVGIPCSDEVKIKISNFHKGKPKSEETKRKMSSWQIGRKMSDEARLNNSISSRKFNKWPHADGAFCKCSDCTKRRNENHYSWKKNKNAKLAEIKINNYILGQLSI